MIPFLRIWTAVSFVLIELFSNPAAYARSTPWENLFQERFFSHYQSGRCGENVLGFLNEGARRQLSLSHVWVVTLVNKGNSMFGLINAEKARQKGRVIPGSPKDAPLFEAGEANWYHHVILRVEDTLYDFDFTNEPTPIPLHDYFEQMFFAEDPQTRESGFYVGKETKLNDYEVEAIPAEEALNRLSAPSSNKLSLGDFLKRL